MNSSGAKPSRLDPPEACNQSANCVPKPPIIAFPAKSVPWNNLLNHNDAVELHPRGLPGENPAEVCRFVLLEFGNSLLKQREPQSGIPGSQTCTRLAGTVKPPGIQSGRLRQEIAHFPEFNSMPDAPSGVKDGAGKSDSV